MILAGHWLRNPGGLAFPAAQRQLALQVRQQFDPALARRLVFHFDGSRSFGQRCAGVPFGGLSALRNDQQLGHVMRKKLLAILSVTVGACSHVDDPTPSSRYDGRYSGTRTSDSADVCGIRNPQGSTSAQVTGGHLTIPLFPDTNLDGSVGEDGSFRAHGFSPARPQRYPQIMIAEGRIERNAMRGEATDFRCHIEIDLQRITPPERPVARPKPNPRPRHNAVTG
jgi:hypothetical protein